MSLDWTGRVLELEVDKVGHGGIFVARSEGRVVFVRHTLPGERIRAVVTEDRGGSFCRADTVEVLEASPDRISPLCPVSGPQGAGCCDFSHVRPEAQRRLKEDVLAEQLERIAKLPQRVAVEALPGAETAGWRTRVRLAVDKAGRPGYRRYRSNEVIADLRCPQVAPGVLDGLDDTVWAADSELLVVRDDDGKRHIVEIDAPAAPKKAHRDKGRRGAHARRTAKSAPRVERIAEGTGITVQRVDGQLWHLAATDFWQAHHQAPAAYSALVSEWASLQPGESAWDLYGGVGVFAAHLAGQVGETGHVDVVESAAQSVIDGKLSLAELPQVYFHTGRVERLIPDLLAEPALALLDPPRAGAGKEVIAALAAREVPRIIHIGCDPASFARDLSLYAEHGYTVAELRAFDAFPMTHHLESFALLTR
ncbi:class I SAM-dependent RNA methyltransferase [Tomitella biformata]|uniref:class I SAM-dependent RNA methyltransferase n=1 Tax=Tomitella biformata TaxID=630403 RepID=UPI000465BB75|nr:TRAM domain-containing protein [Tomitella biformata]